MYTKNTTPHKRKAAGRPRGAGEWRKALISLCMMGLLLLPLSVINRIAAVSELSPESQESYTELEYRPGMADAGLYHTVLLNEAGKVFCWGDNTYGQLGTGSMDQEDAPSEVPDLSDIVMVSAGAYHSVALSRFGNVYAWGRNTFGQVGNGRTESVLVPVRIDNLPPIRAVSAGAFHTLALTVDGEVYAWGNNTSGQIGDVPEEEIVDDSLNILGTRVLLPTLVVPGGASAVSGGGSHSLYLGNQGTVYAWGDNTYGQLGDGDTVSRPLPAPVTGLTQVTHICAGYLHNLAIRQLETDQDRGGYQNLYVWGSDALGQLGLGREFDAGRYVSVPARVDITGDSKPENDRISLIEAGYFHTIVTVPAAGAKEPRDNILVWGDNTYGQLGIGAMPSQNKPVKLEGMSNGWTGDRFLPFQSVAAGGYHTVFYSVKGFLGTVGRADKGQLGNVSTISSSIPIGIRMPDAIAPAWESAEEATVAQEGSQLHVSWNKAKDNIRILKYLVSYINESDEFVTIDTGSANEAVIPDAATAFKQSISVTAIDESGNIGANPLTVLINEHLEFPAISEDPGDTSLPDDPDNGNLSSQPGDAGETADASQPESSADDPEAPRPRLQWSAEAYGSIRRMEVPWDVDYIYGAESILPPYDFTWIIAGGVTLAVILLFVFIGVSTFRKNHRKGVYMTVAQEQQQDDDSVPTVEESIDPETGEEIMKIGEGIEIIQTHDDEQPEEKRWFKRKKIK